MTRRLKKTGRGGAKFTMLSVWLQDTEAWRTMPPGPRALYLEIKRRFTGQNNGSIRLSHREAAELLHVHRNTVGAWFDQLSERGFIARTRGHALGVSGIGETAEWALTEEPLNGCSATKTFRSWRPPEKQKPRTKFVTPRHGIQDTPSQKTGRNKPEALLRIVENKGNS